MGVTVTEATLFGTLDVYDVVAEAKVGESDPWLSDRALKVLAVLSTAALVTVTV